MARWLNVALGAWLAGSALLLGAPGSPAFVADAADGVALALVSLLAPPGTAAGFAAIVLGSWIMAAPSVLAYPSAAAAVNDVVTGILAFAVALHPNLGARRAARA